MHFCSGAGGMLSAETSIFVLAIYRNHLGKGCQNVIGKQLSQSEILNILIVV